jgi:hypothetical protein
MAYRTSVATEDKAILNLNGVQQMKDAWVRNFSADVVSAGLISTPHNNCGYSSFWVNSVAVYAPALRVSNGQAASTGYIQTWEQQGYELSLISTQDAVYSGGGNYISGKSLYRGFVQGVNIGVAGSGGSNMVRGVVIFHTDNTGMRFSISGSGQLEGCNLNATSAMQVDSADRVYFRGTSNAAPAAGDYMLAINGATGKATKTRSVTVEYTPSGSADTNGEEGQITYDDNFMYIKAGGGWRRAALNTF